MITNPGLLLIPLLPLLGAALNGVIALWNASRLCREDEGTGFRIGDREVSWIGVVAPLGALVVAISLSLMLIAQPVSDRLLTHSLGHWFGAGRFQVDWSLMFDPLTMVMVLVVTGVGSLIHLYSVGYMAGDRGYARYFCYLNLFTASMLLLVMARDLVVMFVGWEGVGLCSYLLIGFWFEDPAKMAAGTKAFIVNRIGDLGFLLGLFMLFWNLAPYGLATFDLVRLPAALPVLTVGTATTIALLLFVGAIGKSAQIPLHVWLSDAMAGPTPVSALIHAATMVTAGVYLVARLNPLFEMSGVSSLVVGTVGAVTALFAATVACAQTNIKRVIAWSTISQLGYMFMALGASAYAASVFHLVTHAFFKGLFFLSAGAVIHALHGEEDLSKMGGLWPKLRFTGIAFGIAAMANAGLPPLSGFVSKDAILLAVWGGHLPLFTMVGFLTAAITAFYSTRLVLLVFAGKPRDANLADHAHEPPIAMGLPLVLLSIGAVFVGFLNWPLELGGAEPFSHFLEPVFAAAIYPNAPPHDASLPVIASIAVVALGGAVAWMKFGRSDAPIGAPYPLFRGSWEVFSQRWYIDWIYDRAIVKPILGLSRIWLRAAENAIDGFFIAVSRYYELLSRTLRTLQSGSVRSYAYAMVLGMLALVVLATVLGRTSP